KAKIFMRTVLALLAFGLPTLCDAQTSRDIEVVVKQGAGTREGRAAWDRIASAGPENLRALLDAMSGRDAVADNWLRSAFDRIVQREIERGGKHIDTDRLLTFVKDVRKSGRARRLALDLIEQVRPGAAKTLYSEWLEDPEFRHEAVAQILAEARAAGK